MRWALAAAAVFFLAGCSREGIVGKWDLAFSSDDPVISKRLVEVSDFEKTFEFKDDGTFWVTFGDAEAVGDYKHEGNQITLSSDKETVGELILSEDGETITGVIGKLHAKLTRR